MYQTIAATSNTGVNDMMFTEAGDGSRGIPGLFFLRGTRELQEQTF